VFGSLLVGCFRPVQGRRGAEMRYDTMAKGYRKKEETREISISLMFH